jgi:trk system potassium uptake protein TrkA
MRIVFSGTDPITMISAKRMVELGHEVIIIEPDKAKIDQLSEQIDCSFLNGDASRPAIISQADPKKSDFLFCLSENDQMNIITSLLGRSMGFKRVVTSVSDADLEKLCNELGLVDTIVPARTISRHLENMVRGLDVIELSTLLKGDARFFTFTARKQDEITAAEMNLPENARIIFYYRDNAFHLVENDTRFRKDDEIVILTHSKNLTELRKRWSPETNE